MWIKQANLKQKNIDKYTNKLENKVIEKEKQKQLLENKKLFDLIIKLNLPFDQLIDEKNYQWIHVSYSSKPRKQILHL